MAIVLACASSSMFNYSVAEPIYLPELSNAVDENLFATGDMSYCGHNDVSAARIFLDCPANYGPLRNICRKRVRC